jgi:hypothetical protein
MQYGGCGVGGLQRSDEVPLAAVDRSAFNIELGQSRRLTRDISGARIK